MSDEPCATPLLEMLLNVPQDARAVYEHGEFNHENIPYGYLCRAAATRIAELEQAKRWVPLSSGELPDKGRRVIGKSVYEEIDYYVSNVDCKFLVDLKDEEMFTHWRYINPPEGE